MQKISTFSYAEEYQKLLQAHDSESSSIVLDEGLRLEKFTFVSDQVGIFPLEKQYYAPRLGGSLVNLDSPFFSEDLSHLIREGDREIHPNLEFQYTIFYPEESPANGIIFLLHGLNERNWSKYLPWAQELCRKTQKAVILFPLAFHMDRANPIWQSNRTMQSVSKARQQLFCDLEESSFSNAAMSTRLHFSPARFFMSGLQSYEDIIKLIREIRSGKVPNLAKEARIDFLGYSAGAFLAQILVMANRDQYFQDSRAILFCGGPLLSRMHLSSRYIMDSAAYKAILDFYVHHFPEEIQKDRHLKGLFSKSHLGGEYFRSLLSDKDEAYNQLRKSRLDELQKQFLAISLAKDFIMPAAEVSASLMNSHGQSAIEQRVWDFDYSYSHMNPFPVLKKEDSRISQDFQRAMQEMADFFTSKPT